MILLQEGSVFKCGVLPESESRCTLVTTQCTGLCLYCQGSLSQPCFDHFLGLFLEAMMIGSGTLWCLLDLQKYCYLSKLRQVWQKTVQSHFRSRKEIVFLVAQLASRILVSLTDCRWWFDSRCPRVRLKTADAPKSNGLGQKKNRSCKNIGLDSKKWSSPVALKN